MILYTRALVKQVAEHTNDPDLFRLYFDGNQGAFERVHAICKDATFVESSEDA